MKLYAVEFAVVAERQVRSIAAWWAEHRAGAAALFRRELSGAVERLASAPHSGTPYPVPRPLAVRRLLLPSTGYHVYFTVDDAHATITIRAVWHALRGHGPRLR